jgi:uncharacterized membrane protein
VIFDETTAQAHDAIRRNIESVARLEEEFLRRRSPAERMADSIAWFTGSIWFVVVHAAGLVVWVMANLGCLPGVQPFDPYPFMLLTMWVSTEAVLLSTFVLMKQTRMSRRADQRAHLDLQINLLAEREMTMVLQMLRRISVRLGVELPDEQIKQLTAETSVEALASQLEQKLPEQ